MDEKTTYLWVAFYIEFANKLIALLMMKAGRNVIKKASWSSEWI